MEGAKLPEADLYLVNLQRANLGGADLQGAILGYANLQDAVLGGANLQKTNLVTTNLRGAYLTGVNLQDADLGGADLQGADLSVANLQGASLHFTNLQGVDFWEANLQDVYLHGAVLDKYTTLPDNTKYNPQLDLVQLKRFTDPKHPEFWRSDDKFLPAYRGDDTDESGNNTIVQTTEDDLTKIEGIGSKIAAALTASQIDTFNKLATVSEDDLRSALKAAGIRSAPGMATWAEQAALAASGDWDGLQALQDKLIAGRREQKSDGGE